MTSADPRPRIVEVAFWCWVTAGALLILGGLLEMTVAGMYYRGVAGVCVVLGLGIGYLAGRTRRGDKRFRRASVVLSIVAVVLVLATAVLLGGVNLFAVVAVTPLLVAIVSATRETASTWFDAVNLGADGA
ncbi:MAG: hypothetical protein JO191_08945 [Mycobacteriaceae bacterium]|nr:hypothetical protein [Mycobacteriaceae bacterium]MBV9512542.1 hypothetical protein [Mycobacteriaceae bacterium]